jgi:hypothetical protein
VHDKNLITLVALAAIFYSGHTVDHILRDNIAWALNAESIVFFATTAVAYLVIGVGLYLYLADKVGPRFWAILSAIGVVLGWLAHFSPFTDQPPAYILSAYPSAAAGWLALAILIALMVVLVIALVHAGYLWLRQAPMR